MNPIRIDPTGLKKLIPGLIDNPYTQLGINYGLGATAGAIGQAGYNAATGTNNANPLLTGLQMAPLLGGRGFSKVINTPEMQAIRAKNEYIQMLEDGSTSALFSGALANTTNALMGGKDIDTNMVGAIGYYGQALPMGKKAWADIFAKQLPLTSKVMP